VGQQLKVWATQMPASIPARPAAQPRREDRDVVDGEPYVTATALTPVGTAWCAEDSAEMRDGGWIKAFCVASTQGLVGVRHSDGTRDIRCGIQGALAL
jgi:hypothetical protein